MKSRVCIAGVGIVEDQTAGLSHKEMLFRAVRDALDDAGLERRDITGAVTSSWDFLEGRSLSNQYTLDSIGGVMKPCDLRLGEDGMHAFFASILEVAVDPNQVVVAASVQKASERPKERLSSEKILLASLDPVLVRPVARALPGPYGLESVFAAMDARAYMDRSGLTEDRIAMIARKNLANASDEADRSAPVSVLDSETLAGPVKEPFQARESEAACAIVLTSEKRARRLKSPPVLVSGIGWCSIESYFSGGRIGTGEETRMAAARAYRSAGIRKPAREIDFAEVSDWYAHREAMHCEALGLCDGAEIQGLIADGAFGRDGALPVNPTGGLLGRGNAVGTSGLIRAAQACLQIRGRAGSGQVARASVGLAHSWGGFASPTAGTAVLSTW